MKEDQKNKSDKSEKLPRLQVNIELTGELAEMFERFREAQEIKPSKAAAGERFIAIALRQYFGTQNAAQ